MKRKELELLARCSLLVLLGMSSMAVAQEETEPTPPPPPPVSEPIPEVKAEVPKAPPPEVAKKEEEKVSAGSAYLTPEQLAKLSGFFFSASLDHVMGIGTFVVPYSKPSLLAYVNAFVSYRTQIKGRAFALGLQPFGLNGLFYSYTLPDNSSGRRFSWSDARIALSMPALLKESVTGIVVTPSFNVIVPTTLESWAGGLISRLGLGLSANRTFETRLGQVNVSGSAIGTFGFFRNPAKVSYADRDAQGNIKPQVDSNGNLMIICRQNRQAPRAPQDSGGNVQQFQTTCANAGNNSAIAVQAGIGITWAPKEWLFFSLSYGIQPYWNYPATESVDAYTPMGVDSNGQPVASTGITPGIPLQSGSASVAINLTDAISASLYFWNWAPVWSSDSKRWRFAFWDLDGPANNYTVIGLSLSATY